MKTRDIDVLVVGGGPTGLAAAIELRRLHAGTVVVLEREEAVGGHGAPGRQRVEGHAPGFERAG